MKKMLMLGGVFGLWACESENEPSLTQEIQGEWEWMETTYQYRNSAEGTVFTLASTDTLMVVRIYADEIEILKNDVLSGTFNYSLAASDKTVYLSIEYTDSQEPFDWRRDLSVSTMNNCI